MDATPIDFGEAYPLPAGENLMGMPSPRQARSNTLPDDWVAVHEAARIVAEIAGLDPKQFAAALPCESLSLGQGVPFANGQDVDDLAEILRRGIAALLTAHTSGGAPQAAALALWREFVIARDRIVAEQG
jgi:hypothetical protein